MFLEFLFVKLAEYQALEAVAPSLEIRERIAVVHKILGLYRRQEISRVPIRRRDKITARIVECLRSLIAAG
jgi:hypothetical protein